MSSAQFGESFGDAFQRNVLNCNTFAEFCVDCARFVDPTDRGSIPLGSTMICEAQLSDSTAVAFLVLGLDDALPIQFVQSQGETGHEVLDEMLYLWQVDGIDVAFDTLARQGELGVASLELFQTL